MMIDFALEAERARGPCAARRDLPGLPAALPPDHDDDASPRSSAPFPLALSFGDGGEIRRPLGISIVGGLIVSQMLTLYTTPVLYLYMDEFRLWAKAAGAAFFRALRRPRRTGRSDPRARVRQFTDVAISLKSSIGPVSRPATP